jgi:hypothetical protein
MKEGIGVMECWSIGAMDIAELHHPTGLRDLCWELALGIARRVQSLGMTLGRDREM